MKSLSWGIADYFGLVFFVLVTVYLSISSSLLLKPIALTYNYDENKFVFSRTVRWAHYSDIQAEILVLGTNHECNYSTQARFGAGPPTTVSFNARPETKPCFTGENAGRAKIMTVSYRAKILGLFSLRPTVVGYTLPGNHQVTIKKEG